MHNQKKLFKDTMYAYDNINEYYSFYGNVIYISSDYFRQNDYFIILQNKNQFALIHISKNERERFYNFRNRDNLVEELENLQKTITFTEGFENFIGVMNWNLINTFLEHHSKNELIKLKQNPLVFWNCIMLESMIDLHKKTKTIAPKPILHQTRQLNNVIFTSLVTASNMYNTNFTMSFDWVAGNAFMDIEIYHFSHKMVRRLFIYDILELSKILEIMSKSDEYKTFEAINEFLQ